MTTPANALETTDTAPIALFVYARLDHTRRTVEALRANNLANHSNLFIFADAAKNPSTQPAVDAVRTYLQTIVGFQSVTIIERDTNFGVDDSVIDGVSILCARYGQVIVVEDDIVTSPWFLTYMNEALEIYRSSDRVMQIAGHNFPLPDMQEGRCGFLPFTSSWGWATWQRAWTAFDRNATGYIELKDNQQRRRRFNVNGTYDHYRLLKEFITGATKAWDIRWYLTVFDRNGIILYPHHSFVENIGFDGTGEHCPPSDFAGHNLSQFRISEYPSPDISDELFSKLETYLRRQNPRGNFSYFRHFLTNTVKRSVLRIVQGSRHSRSANS